MGRYWNNFIIRIRLLTSALLLSSCFIGCDIFQSTVLLPNGYKLKEQGARILLTNSNNIVVSQNGISQFMVENDAVYGWIAMDPPQYFFLDTKSGQFEKFTVSRAFDSFIEGKGLPQFNMRFSYTFWDLSSGRRKLGD